MLQFFIRNYKRLSDLRKNIVMNNTTETTMKERKIIINADDYGCDEKHTMGILKAFEERLITNTTIMVNMPFFEKSCELAEKNGIKDRIGLHLNLVEGFPLTEDIKKCSTFCDENGLLHGLWRSSLVKTSVLNKKEKELLKQEIIAQFSLFEERGFTLKHFDTHGHAHTYYSVWKVILKVLKEKGYDYNVRIAKNIFDGNSHDLKSLYKKAINRKIPKEMKSSDYFTDIKGFMKNSTSLDNGSVTEIMCHPCLIDGALVNPGDLQLDELKKRLSDFKLSCF